jgi:hypothetical protein
MIVSDARVCDARSKAREWNLEAIDSSKIIYSAI